MEKKSIKALTEKKDGKLIAIASTEEKDRVGDVVVASGWQLSKFKKNPVIQFAHNYNIPPIGIAKNIRIEGDKLVFEPVFHEITQLAREVKAMYLSEPPIMRAFSVGFIPLKVDEKNPHRILSSELLEISAVPVPANASALTLSKNYTEEEKEGVSEWLKEQLECKDVEFNEEEMNVDIKPYPNEHSCRLKDPAQYDRFARKNCYRKSDGKCIDYIFGIKEGKSEVQALRYPKEEWSEEAAMKHCKNVGGTFEPAKKEETMEQEVKEEIIKGVIPYSVHGDGPKAPEDTAWDAGAEVRKATGNATRLKKMHAWVDSGADNFDPSERQWYKLPHHKGDGNQAVVWNGVRAAMAALFGARGGVDIPDSDRKGVYNHLARHYKQFDKEPPEFREYTKREIYDIFGEDVLSQDEVIEIKLREELERLRDEMTEVKEGRVISGKNREIINKAIVSMKLAISTLRDLLKASEKPSISGEGKSQPKGRTGVVRNKQSKKQRIMVRALQKMAGEINNLLRDIKQNE